MTPPHVSLTLEDDGSKLGTTAGVSENTHHAKIGNNRPVRVCSAKGWSIRKFFLFFSSFFSLQEAPPQSHDQYVKRCVMRAVRAFMWFRCSLTIFTGSKTTYFAPVDAKFAIESITSKNF